MKQSLQNEAKQTEFVEEIIQALKDKKGKDISILNLTNLENRNADYLIICTATSDTQSEALSDNVIDRVKEFSGETPFGSEGKAIKSWILLDYSDVVVHIFLEKTRIHYGLGDLWGDAEIQNLPNQD